MNNCFHLIFALLLVGNHTQAQTWSALEEGTDGGVIALSIGASNNLFVGGHFNNVNSVASQKLAAWDGTNWTSYALGADYSIHELFYDSGNGYLYAGGEFLNIGGVNAYRVAYFDGAN